MIKKLFATQLRRNFMAGPLSTGANVAVMLLGYPLYLRFLGYERYGVWLVLATILTFVQLTNLGIGPAVLKLVAQEHAASRREDVQALVTTSAYIVLAAGVLAFVCVFLAREPIARAFNLSPQNHSDVARLVPYVGALSVYAFAVQIFTATLSGLGRMDLANYLDSGSRLLGLATSIALLWRGSGVVSLLVGNLVTLVVNHVGSLLFISRIEAYRFMRLRDFRISRTRSLFGMASGMMASSALALALHPFNRFAITRWAGVASVPVYEIGFSSAMQMRGLADAGFRALAPEVSRLTATAEAAGDERVRSLVARAQRLILLLGIPVWLAAGAVANRGMAIWLGSRFVPEIATAFRALLVGSFAGLCGVPAFYTLVGLGKTRSIFIANAIQSGVNVALVLAVAALQGRAAAVSVAAAASVGMVLGNAYLVWIVRADFATRRGLGVANA